LQGAATPILKPLLVCVTALVAGFIFAVSLPLYSEWRPQPLNIAHIEDHDKGLANWMIFSDNPVPDALLDIENFQYPESPVLPWYDSTSEPVASAPVSDASAPVFTLLDVKVVANGRQLRLHVESSRGANNLRLMVPGTAEVLSATVNGQPVKMQTPGEGWQGISVTGVPAQGFDMEIVLASLVPVECLLLDWNSKLPAAAAELIEARSPKAAPVHRGDHAMVFTRIRL
jgi:hypothetical protein